MAELKLKLHDSNKKNQKDHNTCQNKVILDIRLLISSGPDNLSGLKNLIRHDNLTGLNDLNSLFGLKKSKTAYTLHTE